MESLGEGATDRHGLANASHRRAQRRACRREFREIETGHFHDHVVERRLERRRGSAGYVIDDLVECEAHRKEGGNLRNRKARRLRGKGRGSAHPRVHFDDQSAPALRVDCELDVGATGGHTDDLEDLDPLVSHLLVLAIGEGLNWSDSDRVASVHTHGIEVLDGADDHRVAKPVTHHLQLVFLPSEDRLLNQDLADRGGGQPVARDFEELLFCLRDPGATSAEDERGPNHHWIADLPGDAQGFGHRAGVARARHFQAGLLHGVLETAPVFRLVDRVQPRADHLDSVAIEHTGASKLGRDVQGRLAPECRE